MRDTGMLDSPLSTQREASAAPSRIYHSNRENSVSSSSHTPVTGNGNLLAITAGQGEQAALSKLSAAECHTRLLLEEQRSQILSEARSEMNMQDFCFEKKQKVQTWPSVNLNDRFILIEWNSTTRIRCTRIPAEGE